MILLPLKQDDKYEKGSAQPHHHYSRRLLGRFKAPIIAGTLLLVLLTFSISRGWLGMSSASPRYYPSQIDWAELPVKGALVVVTREEDIHDVRATMIDIQDRFNERHGYPWVILGDQPFSARFQQRISTMAPGHVYFGQTQTWHEPAFIDIKKAEDEARKMAESGIYHGESLSWRKMARYNTGFLADHPLLQDAEYYWKVEPGSRYLCDINEDPFVMMKSQGKKLAYAITMVENGKTIPTLWAHVKDFISKNPASILPTTSTILPWMLDDSGKYNGNHFWNNFMIVSLDFLRSSEYRAFFQHLDNAGGFFYERWGDAPVQTFAAALFLKTREVHFMRDLGYFHSVATQCPTKPSVVLDLRCACDPDRSFLLSVGSRTSDLLRLQEQQQQVG